MQLNYRVGQSMCSKIKTQNPIQTLAPHYLLHRPPISNYGTVGFNDSVRYLTKRTKH